MASHSKIVQDTYGAVVVRVDHLNDDSFTRSVERAALYAHRKSVNGRSATRLRASYAFHVDGRRCVSMFAFAPSYEAAEGLLNRHETAVSAAAGPAT